ncbi:hypothetical protein O181_125597 [Austropuccinia psidii MF-1]|uniref:Uncharacterized protein n=1 Tax=Austropuccinia psidii MF-1 TaxID=1389203 RepID=A0A9Q3KRT7_9BASI|nr:hypothetical protein [Austropuccinia psidii MF-1]
MGGITQLCTPQILLGEDIYPFGAEFITQDLPCNFGEARILIVLDPINRSRPYRVRFGFGPILGPLVPLGPQKIGPRGPAIAPTDRGILSTAHGPWTIGPKETKNRPNGHISPNHQKSP